MEPIWQVLVVIILVLVSLFILIGMFATKKINNMNEKYSKYKTMSEANAEQIGTILLANSQTPAKVVRVNSNNTNLYSPTYKVLKLSTATADSNSIASLGMVSQQVGYAILDNKKGFLYKIKKYVLPVANVMLVCFIPLLILGMAFSFSFKKDLIGIIVTIISLACLVLPLLIYIITIPVVNKASQEACLQLDKLKFLTDNELYSIKDAIYYSVYFHLYQMTSYVVFLIYSLTRL